MVLISWFKWLIRAEWISLNLHSAEINSTNIKLNAVVYPLNAVNKKVAWYSSDNSIATVDDNWLVTYVSDWECTVTATTIDWWFTDSCTITCKSFTPVDYFFWYTWEEQSILLEPHTYCLEVWGASWWTENGSWSRWWYSWWCITLNSASCLYIYVWWQWIWYNQWCWCQSSWWYNWWWWIYWGWLAGTWWGWTDIRIWWNTLYYRRIVAGWWAWQGYQCSNGWAWWWITWVNWNPWNTEYAYWLWWTQSAAWGYSWRTGWCSQCLNKWVGFWTWWMWAWWSVWWWWWGWGWYWWGWWNISWWWGWSWYVYAATTYSNAPSWYCHCTDYYLTNACTCCWDVSFPSPDWETETWHIWCWCVRIRSID